MLNRNDFREPGQSRDYARQLLLYQQKINNILESFSDGFFEVDKNWTVTYWNKQAEDLLMMPRKDILGKNLWSVYKEAIPLKFYSEYHRAVEEKISVRFEEYFEPKKIWIEVAAFPSGESLSVYFKDITARKHANDLLQMEKQKYQDLFNFSPVPQWVYDLETLAFLQVNEAAIIHYGYSREEFLTMTIKDIRTPEELPVLDKIVIDNVKPGKYNQSIVKHQKKNGEVILVHVEGNSVFFEGKNARLVMAIDQTEKIKAQEELQLSLNRYDIVSKATSDAIWDWDLERGTITWNKGICGIFGYNDVDFDSSWWEENVHPDDIERVRSQFQERLLGKQSRWQVEYRFRCLDGSYKTVLDRAFIVFNSEGEAVRIIGSMQDITERIRHLQAIETQNKRLQEISWLQSHKVRAPLARIMGLAELIDLEDPGKIKELKELAGLILRSANELDNVIKEISDKTIIL